MVTSLAFQCPEAPRRGAKSYLRLIPVNMKMLLSKQRVARLNLRLWGIRIPKLRGKEKGDSASDRI